MATITPSHASPTAPAKATPAEVARPRYRVTGRRVLRSEWAKLWSLRSTWITLGLGLVFLVAFGIIAAVQYKSVIGSDQHIDTEFARATAVDLSLFGTNFAQLALGVLGVLVTAGEYSTGMIRSTLTAVPRRLPVLWSKAAVFGVVVLVVSTAGAVITFLVASGIVSGTPAALTLWDAGVLRSLLGAGLYLSLVGVIGTALGALLRSVAGGHLGPGRLAAAGPGSHLAAAQRLAQQHQPVSAQQCGQVDVRTAPRGEHPHTPRGTRGLSRLGRPGPGGRGLPAGAHRRLSPSLRMTAHDPGRTSPDGVAGPSTRRSRRTGQLSRATHSAAGTRPPDRATSMYCPAPGTVSW